MDVATIRNETGREELAAVHVGVSQVDVDEVKFSAKIQKQCYRLLAIGDFLLLRIAEYDETPHPPAPLPSGRGVPKAG